MVLFEKFYGEQNPTTETIASISYKQCLAIGSFQAISVIPGVSRAAATIIGGLILGLPRKTVVEFSFLLAMPTMIAAASLDIYKNANNFSQNQISFLAVGFITSFVMATIAIRFLLSYIKRKDFTAFGVYRIVLAILFWLGIK